MESGGAAKEPVEGACGDGVQHSTMVEVPDRWVVLRIRMFEAAHATIRISEVAHLWPIMNWCSASP